MGLLRILDQPVRRLLVVAKVCLCMFQLRKYWSLGDLKGNFLEIILWGEKKLSFSKIYGWFKAQFTIISLIMVFVMLVIYSQLYPVMKPFIDDLIGDLSGDPATAAIIGMIPFFIAVAIIMSVLYYIIPQRR